MAVSVSFEVSTDGPILHGRGPEITHHWMDEVKRDIADEGEAMLRAFVMNKSGPSTGHYQSEIQTRTVAPYNDLIIHDPVVYGPWLEGVSERNRSTRFKGYHLWRITRQKLRAKAPEIAQAKLPELSERLGDL
jgi:hypothetical protein